MGVGRLSLWLSSSVLVFDGVVVAGVGVARATVGSVLATVGVFGSARRDADGFRYPMISAREAGSEYRGLP